MTDKNVFSYCYSKDQKEIPLYSEARGYGFKSQTSGICPREVATERIVKNEKGYVIQESLATIQFQNINHYNYGGLVFRIDIEALGAYKVEVTTTSAKEDTWISVSGMQPDWMLSKNPWDAAALVPKNNFAQWEGNTWRFDFVTGRPFIEIEVEPLLGRDGMPEGEIPEVGISRITLTKIENPTVGKSRKPSIFTLGDSTVKSYVFEEAGMSGWGQVFDDLFDLSEVEVINYSQGGRSFKSMYTEGRFNEILMRGKPGDYILVQSGHNDESTDMEKGPAARFGRGSTAASYEAWMREVYIPAIRSRGMVPILVSPMTRINYSSTTESDIVWNGFKNSKCPGIDFPQIMKETAKDLEVLFIDLYEESIIYLKEVGGKAAKAMFLSVEAGEYPSKTNSGSYANGNPSGSADGTHYKETLSKQWARIVVSELWKQQISIARFLKEEVKKAIQSGDWEGVYPEIPKDTQTGDAAYYRNQIEKIIQLGVLTKDAKGMFYPTQAMDTFEFVHAMNQLWKVTLQNENYQEGLLNRQKMGAILYDAYRLKFGKDDKGHYKKPKYLTDYNGVNLDPKDPHFDSNLAGESAQYYPLTPWNKLTDLDEIQECYFYQVKEAYHLGLIRSEKGIERGKMMNGKELEPRQVVTREKAAKALFFMWVLPKDIKQEND